MLSRACILGLSGQKTRPPGSKRDRPADSGVPEKTGGFVKAKSGLTLKGILLTAVVLIAANTFAASNKGSLELQHPASVAGKQLATGNYTLRWEGTGDQVELKIYHGKDVVASTPAKLVQVEHPTPSNSAVVNTNSDGSYSLSQIRFGGKHYALEIPAEGEGASGAAASR
jgi:hypothetical protein